MKKLSRQIHPVRWSLLAQGAGFGARDNKGTHTRCLLKSLYINEGSYTNSYTKQGKLQMQLQY